GSYPYGIGVVEVAERGCELRGGRIPVAEYDRRWTQKGYDLTLTALVSTNVQVPVIASGGVGKLEHLYEGLTTGGADALLAASIFHFGQHRINDVKCYLQARGVWMRPC